MSYLDEKVKHLYAYSPPLTKRADFAEFWSQSLKLMRDKDAEFVMQPSKYPSNSVKVFDIKFKGFDDTVIHGWYILPHEGKGNKYPCVIHYPGYTNGRGVPSDYMHWVLIGFAVLAVDCREQGGLTGNSAVYTCGSCQSVASKGLLNKEEYYYRAVYCDCVRAYDLACLFPEIDAYRIILEGSSQGGALSIAVAALGTKPWLVLADVPSMSNLEKRVDSASGAFSSVSEYLRRYPYDLPPKITQRPMWIPRLVL